MEKLALKIDFKGDLRRLPISHAETFDRLSLVVAQIYSLQEFQIKYVDDEGDLITLTCDEELNEAIRLALLQPNNVLRLSVYETKGNGIKFSPLPQVKIINKPQVTQKTLLLPLIASSINTNQPIPSKYFRESYTYKQRKELATNMKQQHNDSIPVIVEKINGSGAPTIRKNKFLINKTTTVRKFIGDLQQCFSSSSKGEPKVHFYVNRKNTQGKEGFDYYGLSYKESTIADLVMLQVYTTFVEEDSFLYITYTDNPQHFAY